ncbi:SAM-dependent methyltransferase [Spiractinospora alimapuensis]|nr:SAM-dependent methyltransferase [Spiractinospora alimapuensis]
MKRSSAQSDSFTYPPGIPTDRPTAARMYGIPLGSKDNFEVDRQSPRLRVIRLPGQSSTRIRAVECGGAPRKP